jgi:EAL domain-containing protein (putative c-di-GMP-specific phosphodiesterase class I)
MPGEFIPICERNGLIVSIGYWTIRQAGLHLKMLEEEGIKIDRLGVNLSFRQFKDEMLVDTIKRIIKQEAIDTSILEFELTESAIFNDEEHVRNCLDSLAEEGITFSLDDFGTGYSSFSLLHKLPISALKVDRSFVSQVNESSEAAEIVRSIINLAQNMNLTVIAEGVETREQLDFLIKHNCDEIQGYFYSPPVCFNDFKRMFPKH